MAKVSCYYLLSCAVLCIWASLISSHARWIWLKDWEFWRFGQRDLVGGKRSMKSISVSPLMPLYALLSVSFLHLILLSFHFLFLLRNAHTAERPNIQSGGPVRCDLTLIHRLPFLVAQSPRLSCGDQWNLIIMHHIDQPPRDLATLYLKIADRLWQTTSWMNEGCCWNRLTQIGQREAYGIIRDARSE